MFLQMALSHFLNNRDVLLHMCTTSSLSIPLSVNA